MLKKSAVVWKKIGQTPLEATEEYRVREKLGVDIPLAYAGRLDPMAEGKLLILIGDECKKLKAYTGLDKEYEFQILFGFSSDTGDVLGLAESNALSLVPNQRAIKRAAKKFIGAQNFAYPRFSSKTVNGKPLYRWTLENRLHEIEIPMRASTIYAIRLLEMRMVQKEELEQEIFNKIHSLAPVTDLDKAWGADFRRQPILVRWKEIFVNTNTDEFYIARLSAIVSSGTYIRTLAEKIGEALGVSGLAYSITRTNIGKYMHFKSFGFWTKSF
jgi:tRNA pseudouridine55 synthase